MSRPGEGDVQGWREEVEVAAREERVVRGEIRARRAAREESSTGGVEALKGCGGDVCPTGAAAGSWSEVRVGQRPVEGRLVADVVDEPANARAEVGPEVNPHDVRLMNIEGSR